MLFSFEIGEQLKCDDGLGHIPHGMTILIKISKKKKKIEKYYVPK